MTEDPTQSIQVDHNRFNHSVQ